MKVSKPGVYRIDSLQKGLSRRRLLQAGALCSVSLALLPREVLARANAERTISLDSLHTGETVKTVFWQDGCYVPGALAEINHVLRDHRTGEVKDIDPSLLDLLYILRNKLETNEPFGVISGYRSPATNARLRESGHGVAKHSYHIKGMAIDIRLSDHRLRDLHRAALSLKAGGVGYYPASDFVHVDTGPVRHWS
jgi:uncharacterized protein YcbK (DUF882 family)